MIITLIFIGLLIAGIACIIVYNNTDCGDWAIFVGSGLLVVSIVVLVATGCVIIDNQINKDINYQNKLHEREMLEYRIDNMEDSIVGNEMLYSDIVEFNNEIRSVKKWANNPWTNWFNNELIASIDYIELDGN